MQKGTQIKTVICGVALVALASVPVATAQTNPCFGSGFSGGVCNRFDSTHQTNKYLFGDHFIKFTVNVVTPFDLNVEAIPITNSELDNRVISPLAPVDCIPYVGATSNTNLGTCVFYHVTNPPSPSAYTGPVIVKIFWDFPTLAILNNVRLYRAPLDGADNSCPQGFDCYTQDITDQVFAVGDHNSDAGVGGDGTGFSDFEAVDQTSTTSTAARTWLGLKNSDDVGTRFDLHGVVKKNGTTVSSGTLLGALGGSSGFSNAILRTIPLSTPSSSFSSGDTISLEVSARNSCVGTSHNSGTARLWFNDAAANSRVNEPGAPTMYLVAPGITLNLSSSVGTGPKKTKDVLVGARDLTCNGPFTAFGTWSGTVP
ncbi:MAG TPA: hypothetical protein VKH43_12110 [Thermoanaerobaculia bacterium]|nr:hypothetical protein [Thermoanaerobaculia bacterium]